jgi:hypothetical protein
MVIHQRINGTLSTHLLLLGLSMSMQLGAARRHDAAKCSSAHAEIKCEE